jgi:hypothetical protein
MTALNVLHHAPRFRVLHDGLAALAGQIIHLFDLPVAALGVEPSALFVMFGAFASGLIFGGNPNPDANGFDIDKIFLHSTTSYQKPNSVSRKKYVFLLIGVVLF